MHQINCFLLAVMHYNTVHGKLGLDLHVSPGFAGGVHRFAPVQWSLPVGLGFTCRIRQLGPELTTDL